MDKRDTPLLSTLLMQKFNTKQTPGKSDVRDSRAFLPGKSEGSQVDCLFPFGNPVRVPVPVG